MANANTKTEPKAADKPANATAPNAPDEKQGETNPTAPKEPQKGKTNGETESAAQTQEALDTQTRASYESRIAELEAERDKALAANDPTKVVVDTDAFDATRPRGPEAPMETLKPSQRQGQGIPMGAGANETATGVGAASAGEVPSEQEQDESHIHPMFRTPKEDPDASKGDAKGEKKS